MSTALEDKAAARPFTTISGREIRPLYGTSALAAVTSSAAIQIASQSGNSRKPNSSGQ